MISTLAGTGDGPIDCDIAVVGGGPAGITIANAFLDRPERVLLVESGGLDLDTRVQALHAGSRSGVPYFPLDESRYRMLGGSTFRWGARSAPFKPLDFAPRDWLGLPGWPIPPDALSPWYQTAWTMAGIHLPFAFDGDVWRGMRVRPAAFDPALFDWHAFQFGTNLLFGQHFRDGLARSETVRVLLNTDLLAIATDPDRRHVTMLEVGDLDGRRAVVRARRVVLAAGGIENARLLLLAGLGGARVGERFMEHPTVSAGTIVAGDPQALVDSFSPGLVGGRLVETALALTPRQQRETNSLQAVARVAVVVGDDPTQALRELLRNLKHRRLPHQLSWYQKNRWLTQRLGTIARDPFSLVGNAVRHRLGRPKRFKLQSVYLELRTEQAPDPDSRVTLATETDAMGRRRAHLHWSLGQQDKRTMRVLAGRFDAELRRLRLGHLDFAPWLLADDLSFGADLVGGHHHMGTTAMSADPADGVVDADCRVHGMDNLFVAGSSVFPTAGFVNPTATLIALARRLADHLARSPA